MLKRENSYRVTSNELDSFDHFKITGLLDLSQTIASTHASELDIGYQEFLENNKEWFVISSRFTFYSNPNVNDLISIVTMPHKSDHLFCLRDYLFYGPNQELIAKGSSKWIIYDKETKRICPCSHIFENQDCTDEYVYKDNLNKIEMGELSEYQYSLTHQVMRSEIDHYKHFNNTYYANIFYDIFELTENDFIEEFQIDYINQCFLGDEIKVYSLKKDKLCLYYGSVKDKVVFQAQIKLK